MRSSWERNALRTGAHRLKPFVVAESLLRCLIGWDTNRENALRAGFSFVGHAKSLAPIRSLGSQTGSHRDVRLAL